MLKDYAPLYIFADRESLFSNFTSSKMLLNECVTLSQPIHDEMCKLAHTIIANKKSFTVVLGGPLNTLSLSCLLNLTTICDRIVLMGEIGLSLALIKLKIWNIGRLSYLKIHREIIIKVLESMNNVDVFAEIIFPKGVIIREKVEEEVEDITKKSTKKATIMSQNVNNI